MRWCTWLNMQMVILPNNGGDERSGGMLPLGLTYEQMLELYAQLGHGTALTCVISALGFLTPRRPYLGNDS